MIRIDEIYNHTFWPWFEKNRAGTRVFFCDPPGHTDVKHLFNLGRDDTIENSFVFFHDQEPIHLDAFKALFEEVVFRNWDFYSNKLHKPVGNTKTEWPDQQFKNDIQQYIKSHDSPIEFLRSRTDDFFKWKQANSKYFNLGNIVVSERGEYVEQLEDFYGWKSHYYFYHGWACLDWFRGYDRSFLIPRARDRAPTQTFMSPNRIVAGKRDHRVLFLYNVFKHGLQNNHISAPRICPVENVDIVSIAQKYSDVYQDITNVFEQATLPRLFCNEDTQHMTSCHLTNFDEAADSLVYVPTETVYFGRRTHITEKTFKAIALEMPFVLVAPAGSLSYLREYGFKTFDSVFDESYDLEINDLQRIEKVTQLLKDLDTMTVQERQKMHKACLHIVEHNYNHFYRGGFANILWQELKLMLEGIRV
jgi:hypothetical protein